VVSFLLAFPPISYIRYSSPHSCYMLRQSHAPRLDHSNYSLRGVHVLKLLIIQPSPTSRHFIPFRFKYSLQRPVLKHPESIIPTRKAWILTNCNFIYKIIQTMASCVCVCVCVCVCLFVCLFWHNELNLDGVHFFINRKRGIVLAGGEIAWYMCNATSALSKLCCWNVYIY
jgi:hypothetical protein